MPLSAVIRCEGYWWSDATAAVSRSHVRTNETNLRKISSLARYKQVRTHILNTETALISCDKVLHFSDEVTLCRNICDKLSLFLSIFASSLILPILFPPFSSSSSFPLQLFTNTEKTLFFRPTLPSVDYEKYSKMYETFQTLLTTYDTEPDNQSKYVLSSILHTVEDIDLISQWDLLSGVAWCSVVQSIRCSAV